MIRHSRRKDKISLLLWLWINHADSEYSQSIEGYRNDTLLSKEVVNGREGFIDDKLNDIPRVSLSAQAIQSGKVEAIDNYRIGVELFGKLECMALSKFVAEQKEGL